MKGFKNILKYFNLILSTLYSPLRRGGVWGWGCGLLLTSCDLLHCTNYSVQCLDVVFYDSEGNETTLVDTLTVKACGTDSILINRDVYADEMLLPLSYLAEVDTFVMRHAGEDYVEFDTLYITKTNEQYFESPDCPTRMMHTIFDARIGGSNFTDSVKIANSKIGFESNVNLKLYLKP